MRSPFPGIDPFLSQRWGDFHAGFVTYMRDALQPGLPGGLRARMEERVYVESEGEALRAVRPDYHVYETAELTPGAASQSATALADPFIVKLPECEVTETFVQIIDVSSGNRVITVIELLSPSNKRPGSGRDEYLKKQHEYVSADINVVELDFTWGGEPTTLVHPHALSRVPAFRVSVRKKCRSGQLFGYPTRLQDPLPRIAIPLRHTDADLPLDLQALVELTCEHGQYDDIDYSRSLVPTPAPDDISWMNDVLKSRSK